MAPTDVQTVPWWKEPTKEQWHAWVAAWLGWTLDAFDFSIFLLIMLPIAQDFNVPLTAVTAVFTITLWLRLAGATGAGWLSDRIGRKKPLMISILWYSICNLLAGLAPSFLLLFLFRALLGIGMGAEWPCGAALAMETWPQRSRGLMAGVLQASWGIGALLSSVAYALLYDLIGWRGLLIIGVLPALAVVYIRKYVKEPELWTQNRAIQRERKSEVRAPLFAIFRRNVLLNTLNACWWMASGFIVAYSIGSLFPTHMQKDLGYSPAMVAFPVMVQSFLFFCSGFLWGWVADKLGRRWALIFPAIGCLIVTPLYLFTQDYTMIVVFFGLQGMFGAGGMYATNPSYLSERFPTEVRATAAGFCYHQGAIFGGLTAPIIAFFAVNWGLGFAIPMAIGTFGGTISFIIAMSLGPETRGKHLTPELGVAVT